MLTLIVCQEDEVDVPSQRHVETDDANVQKAEGNALTELDQ